MKTRLRLAEFSVGWSGVVAVAGLDLSVDAGEVIGIFGHNGAGKSSLLLGVGGFAPGCSGRISLDGEVLDQTNAAKRASLGISSSFQAGRVFAGLTVREHLRLAIWRTHGLNQHRAWPQQVLDAFPILITRGETVARNLSGGERQILATAMALVRQPRLLLLDEPLTGLSRSATTTVLDLALSWANTSGCAVIFVEQRFEEAIRVCTRWLVLSDGKVAATAEASTDSAQEIRGAIAGRSGAAI